MGDKAVILLIRFLKAERDVGQGVLQDLYGRMGKMVLNPDIERISYQSHVSAEHFWCARFGDLSAMITKNDSG